MSPSIVFAVLIAALLHAVWNALVKVSGDRLVTMGITAATAAIMATPLLFVFPLPAAQSWIYLLLSVVLHAAYMLLLVKSYSHGDFVQIYPVARGSAPLLTGLLGFILLKEKLTPTEISGMFFIVAGIFALALERIGGVAQMSRPALFYSLLTGLCITGYSLVDGVGARLSGSSHGFIVWMFFLDGLVIPVIALLRRKNMVRSTIKMAWKPGVAVAIISSAAYWIVIWAYSQERIAPIAALRETSVLFALLISAFILKETINAKRLGVILMMVSGVALLAW